MGLWSKQKARLRPRANIRGLTGDELVVLISVCMTVAISDGYVFVGARARGLPVRRAVAWSALQAIEFPLFVWLGRRARPKRFKGEYMA
jgi:hypothetical protein